MRVVAGGSGGFSVPVPLSTSRSSRDSQYKMIDVITAPWWMWMVACKKRVNSDQCTTSNTLIGALQLGGQCRGIGRICYIAPLCFISRPRSLLVYFGTT